MLSDAARRQRYLERPRRDWDAFFEACGDDDVIEEIKALNDVTAGVLPVGVVLRVPSSTE